MKFYFYIVAVSGALSGSLNAFSQQNARDGRTSAESVTAKITGAPNDRSIRFNKDTVCLRFSVYQHYPFIETIINGIKGKLMFDTGSGFGLTVNDVAIPLKNGKTTGHGFTGSGQSFDTHEYDTVQTVKLGDGLTITNGGPVAGFDISFMNVITTDILGMIGYKFFEGYLFKLDYKQGFITFYKNSAQRQKTKDFLKGEKVIGVIHFEHRKLVNIPILSVVSESDTLAVAFDTGQLGTLYLTDELKKQWLDKGHLILANDGSPLARLKSMTLPGGLRITPGDVHSFPPKNAAAHNQSIGITETNSLVLGYSFLSQYKTVWDYDQRKIYLLEK